ncbi:MAG: hypothetical protein CFE45_08735 [Burkholderiales bacterium PBB5]|nr:MAG: hypothetical protein CFE45_08735 [Burkholderiales bacterium PBB5]
MNLLDSTIGGSEDRQTASNGEASAAPQRQSPATSANAVLLTDEQAARYVLGVSPRTFSTLLTAAWMPQPISLGPRLRRWHRGELEAAIANAPRQAKPGSEPAQLARARIDRMKRTGVPA